MARPRHPAGLAVLFLTEMWERFSFYLMLAILPLYIADSQTGGMGRSDEFAAVVVGTYMGLVYFTPFIGGLIADRILGYRRTILIGATLMMIGHVVLAVPTEAALYVGLGFLILGNGAFKPNISSLLGNLYPPGSPLKEAGYNIFYLGINLGAFLCTFVAAFVRNHFNRHPLHLFPGWEVNGWHVAFGTAGVGMFIGLVIFSLNFRRFYAADQARKVGAAPQADLRPLWLECLIPAVILGAVGWYLTAEGVGGMVLDIKGPTAAFLFAIPPVLVFYFNVCRRLPDAGERNRVKALYVIFGASVVFWMIFNLNTTALNVWARDNTDRRPNAVTGLLINASADFAEDAGPDYFKNASPDTPRPPRSAFLVVSPKEYDQHRGENALQDKKTKQFYVTRRILDEVYAGANSSTPTLEEKQPLKLANTELFQSINAGYIILLTPLIVWFWRILRRRGGEPSTSGKIGLGLLIMAGAPLVMMLATWVSGDGAMKVSAWWLFGTYAVVTVAELCLSPMGLALVNKVSPPKIQAFMMGGWFLSTSVGSKLSGLFGEAYQSWNHYVFWTVLVASCLLSAAVVFGLLPWLNRQMGAGQPAAPEPARKAEKELELEKN